MRLVGKIYDRKLSMIQKPVQIEVRGQLRGVEAEQFITDVQERDTLYTCIFTRSITLWRSTP